MKNRLLNSANAQRFIIFVAGIIVSAVFAELVALSISWSTSILVFLNVLLCLVTIFFISDAFSNLNDLLDKTEISVEYITEPYEDGSYIGSVYKRLQVLVEQAESEILYLSTGGKNDENAQWRPVMGHETRVSFLRAIESKVSAQKNKGFKYVLIRQIHPEQDLEKLHLSKPFIEHCTFILNAKNVQAKYQGFTIDLLKVPPQRMNSFILVDKRYIVIFLYSDLKDASYASGIMIVEDRGGKMMKKMNWYFAHLERIGQPAQVTELIPR